MKKYKTIQENQAILKLDSNKHNPKLTDIINSVKSKRYIKSILNLIMYSIPIILSYLFQAAIPATNIYFLAHLDKQSLAIASIANTFTTLFGYCIILGLSTSLDTLCSQSYTFSEDKKILGLYLQRNILLSHLCLFPLLLFWWNCSSFLKLFLNTDMAEECQIYIRILSFTITPYICFENIKKFLQAQGHISASTQILAIAFILNIMYNKLLIDSSIAHFGLYGAAVALVLTFWSILLLSILYVYFIQGKQAWGGFDSKAFYQLGKMFKLGLPGVMMISCDFLAFEIMLISAAKLGTLCLATHTIMVTISNLNYMVFHGLSISGSTIIGNLLGKGYSKVTCRTSRLLLLLGLCLSLLTSLSLFLFRKNIATFFSKDNAIINNLIYYLPLVSLNMLFDGLATLNNGLLRGQGRQSLGANINFISFYIIGIPTGLILCFYFKFKLIGLWLGLALALFCVAFCLSVITLCTDWHVQVKNCFTRLHVFSP